MRFDDTLDTVLSGDHTSIAGAQAAWRQLIDLVGRGRIAPDDRVFQALAELRERVALPVRAASARALFGTTPPLALVRFLSSDEISVAAPVLRTAQLDGTEWSDLMPSLSPASRAVLRHRRDLPPEAQRALESFGPVDFVISGAAGAAAAPAADAGEPPIEEVTLPVTPIVPQDNEPFLTVGSIARSIPVVAEALRREAHEPSEQIAPPPPGGAFRISDVVARIEAYRERKENESRSRADAATGAPAAADTMRFECDERGAIRWVEGIARGAAIGLSLAYPGRGAEGVDAGVSGAFRQRARFTDLHLTIGGRGPDSGLWLISGVPVFDPASGRFTGYRGSGRRPRTREVAASPQPPGTGDSLRQLVHELRTPVNAIAGFSEMIEHQVLGPVPEPYRRDARVIHRDAMKLLDAIEDIDIAARLESRAYEPRPEATDLGPIVHRLLAELEREGTAVSLEGRAGAVWADRRAADRIVARLIGVAASIIDPGEGVDVTIEEAAGTAILSVSRPKALQTRDDAALFDIGDDDGSVSLLGVGFALRLVRSLAEELGGRLLIERDRLTLHLPLALDDVMEQARPQ